jgi:hypothetical protein
MKVVLAGIVPVSGYVLNVYGGYPPPYMRSLGINDLQKISRQIFGLKGVIRKIFRNKELVRCELRAMKEISYAPRAASFALELRFELRATSEISFANFALPGERQKTKQAWGTAQCSSVSANRRAYLRHCRAVRTLPVVQPQLVRLLRSTHFLLTSGGLVEYADENRPLT